MSLKWLQATTRPAARSYWPYAAPARYIFREFSMKLEGGLQFYCKDPVLAQPVPRGGISYRHGFNFRIENGQKSTSATGGDLIVPIIVDPDVGHPGGSQS